MIKETEENKQEQQNQGRNLASQVQDKAKEWQEAAQEWQRRASEGARRAMEATDDYVHENPWPVIGSVALGFFALGFLVGRSRD